MLNLWQKNHVFGEEIIQPLFDLADPNHPIQKQIGNQIAQKGNKTKSQSEPQQLAPPVQQQTPNTPQTPQQQNVIQQTQQPPASLHSAQPVSAASLVNPVAVSICVVFSFS